MGGSQWRITWHFSFQVFLPCLNIDSHRSAFTGGKLRGGRFWHSTLVRFGYASLGKCWGKIKEWSFIPWYPHRIFLRPTHHTYHYIGKPERVLEFHRWTGGLWTEIRISTGTVPWHWMLYTTAGTGGGERSWSSPWQPLKRRHQKEGM